jgi:hypothetical protein
MIRRRLLVAAGLTTSLAVVFASLASHPMMPDPKLTPGATDTAVTQATIKTTICVAGYTKTVRSVSEAERQEVATRYGVPVEDLKSRVEVDHFESLEIGGSNDLANLWPQYYRIAGDPPEYLGAREKDVVEDSLHRAVCSGKMTLAEAQEAIRSWPDIYRRIKRIKE